MDNVTHALAGIVAAEVALELRRRRTGRSPTTSLTRAAWLASAGANNVPDLDFVYTGVLEQPLGYLLHHRGHTHTLLLAPLVALLPFAASLALGRWSARREKEPELDRSARALLLVLSLLGAVTHIAMDATNNYGVHPFWPLDAHWYFGDTVFIIEPLWWVVLSAPLVFTAKARWARVLFALPPVVAIALAVGSGVVLPPFVALLGALAPLLFYASLRLSRGPRAWLALGLGVLVPLVFATQGAAARASAREVLRASAPGAELHDIVLTPMPGNPFCWSGLSVETQADELRYRRFAVSTWPSAMSAEGCHTDPPRNTTAPRLPIFEGSRVDVWLHDTLIVPLPRLRALAHEDCRVAAFMRFSRAPFVVEAYDATVLGDARYDMSRDLSWSKLRLSDDAVGSDSLPSERRSAEELEASLAEYARDCARQVPAALVPGWVPPRADVLEGH